jgi:C4-dicarboxylate-specific signal transduction histidine kinase
MTLILLSFILANYLKKKLLDDAAKKKWLLIFNAILIFTPILFIAYYTLNESKIIRWAGNVVAVYLLVICLREETFKKLKLITVAITPLVVISVIGDFLRLINPGFLKDFKSYINIAKTFSLFWLVGIFILYRRQIKAQEKEHLQRAIEMEENRKNLERKAELENMVQERTAEITAQKETLEATLAELSSTQQQLIHSEKMASLGELTAGIAHEIQNPLNFINNFSELNAELTEELVEALERKEWDDIKDIAGTIRDNSLKVAHHGKRADSIVKSMLQHSRGGGKQKEPVEMNLLADECIRLSFHGMRAKEKSFNAKIETHLAENLPKLNGIASELGRVMLNISTNAFYAVLQKSRSGIENYNPTVWLETKEENNQIKISFRDNGTGIPKKAIDKIFQPFFTTKPTGEGTGLGLSMSYEIITNVHGGELKVDSVEGEGTNFTILLPLNGK